MVGSEPKRPQGLEPPRTGITSDCAIPTQNGCRPKEQFLQCDHRVARTVERSCQGRGREFESRFPLHFPFKLNRLRESSIFLVRGVHLTVAAEPNDKEATPLEPPLGNVTLRAR